jgi:hypothetical protein
MSRMVIVIGRVHFVMRSLCSAMSRWLIALISSFASMERAGCNVPLRNVALGAYRCVVFANLFIA